MLSGRTLAGGASRPHHPLWHFRRSQTYWIYWFARWKCEPFTHGISVSERGECPEVIMSFVTDGFGPGGVQRWHVLPVSAQEPVQDQVRRFVERIATTDPRENAEGP